MQNWIVPGPLLLFSSSHYLKFLNLWAEFLVGKNYYMLDLHNVANEVNNFTPFRRAEKQKRKGEPIFLHTTS